MSSSDPPGKGPSKQSSTMIGFGLPEQEPAAPAPPAPATPADAAPPADRGSKRTLPPPNRGSLPPPNRAPGSSIPPTPSRGAVAPVVGAPSPIAPAPSGPAPFAEVPSGPTQPYPAGAPPMPASGPVPYPTQEANTAPATYPHPAAPPYAPTSAPTSAPASAPHSAPIPQPIGPHSGPTSMPPGGQASQPYGGAPAGHTSQPFGGAPAGHASQPFGGAPPSSSTQPFQGAPATGPHADPAFVGRPSAGQSFDEIPGSEFVKFLKISLKRAFRLRIEPNEVLHEERLALQNASPPILDVNLQAFLAWRRSVLFLVACALVPLTVIGLIDALRSRDWTAIFVVKFVPAFAELLFCWICWSQLKRWHSWRLQRRKLFWGWLLFMLAPFAVFVYPLETIIGDVKAAFGAKAGRDAMIALGWTGIYQKAVQPFAFSMLAMLQLAPKAISLMPGLIRSSLVIKLLFPGVSSPGWLIVMASPMYALLAYVILIIPYQFTGSGWFVAGILGVVAGQAMLARAGFALARPQTEEEAHRHIKRVRAYYMTVMTISALLIVVALGSLVFKLNLRVTDVILAILKFESNVLILTMIGADLVITNLDKARHYTRGRDDIEGVTENKIAAFVSFEQPPPPPPGPAT